MKQICMLVDYMKFSIYFVALMASGCAYSAQLPAGEIPRDSPLVGTWLVKEVHGDIAWGAGASDNDPTILWRYLTISPDAIRNNIPGGNEGCISPKSERLSLDANSLLGTDRPDGVGNDLSDFGIKGTEHIKEVMRFRCGDGDVWVDSSMSSRSAIEGAWLLPLRSGDWAMRWQFNTILVITKVQDFHEFIPSFDCRKASNTAEKTICDSIELSGYDKSIARVYENGISYIKSSEEAANLRSSQVQWLKDRSACGQNVECIRSSMVDRIDELIKIVDGAE
jgi:uncharacterized protein YecT (DUF1311 family)